MQAASIALAVIGGCALAAAVAIELATGDPAAGANYGEAEPDNMHEAELGIKGAFQPQIFGRETVDSASRPASPVLIGYGRRVGSLGPA
jgi:hypothetical protein